MWFRSGLVTSREAHPQALCVPWCPCPPQPQWMAGDVTSTLYHPPVPPTEHLLSHQPPPPPPQPPLPPSPQSGVPSQGQGHGTFQPDTDARWPDWPVHTAPAVALGPQPESHADSWRRREQERRRRRTQGTNSHKREQVELKLTGSAEQLNVRNSSQSGFKVNQAKVVKVTIHDVCASFWSGSLYPPIVINAQLHFWPIYSK